MSSRVAAWIAAPLLAAAIVAVWFYERAPLATPPPPVREPSTRATPPVEDLRPPENAAALPIRGRVVDPRGVPFAHARVAVRSGAHVAERIFETDAQGAFETIALAPGRYTLLAWVRNDAEQEAERGLLAARLAEDVAAGSTDVTIALVPAARTRGRVEDAQGRPVARAHVIARGSRGLSHATAISDAAGAFELVLPRDEDCTLEVRLPGAKEGAEPLALPGVRGGAPDVVVRAP